MNFEITQEIDLEVEPKSAVIYKVSDLIKRFLSNRSYGDELQNFFIAFICVKPRPGYEKWFTIREPKYKSLEKIKLADGSEKELIGVFGYDLKLDFENFLQSSEEEAEILLGSEIIKSLSNFDKLPKKVKNFDSDQFKNDLELFLQDELKIT